MIEQRLCGGFTIPDRFDGRELVLLQFAFCLAQDNVDSNSLRAELVELENKIFGDNQAFINELDNLLKT